MNDFVDFWVVLAKPSLSKHLRGYGAVGFPQQRYAAPSLLTRLIYAFSRWRAA